MNVDRRRVDIEVPDEVADSEFVARVVMDPKSLQDGRLGRSAFELRNTIRVPDELYVSVMRVDYCGDVKELISKFPAPKNNFVSGYAKMSVGAIRSISGVKDNKRLDVEVKAEKNGKPQSPHAGIFTMIDSNAVTGSRTSHVSVMWTYVQSKLVEIAEYVCL